MHTPPPAPRGALIGAIAALLLVLAEVCLRYLPRLQGTDLSPQPALALLAALAYLALAVPAGLIHPLAPAVALALAAARAHGPDPAALLLAALAGLLAIPAAARAPRASLSILLLTAIVLLLAARQPPTSALRTGERSAESDIVLVVLDTVAAQATGLHGYGLPTTPHLDGLAAEGAWFAAAISAAPWTVPSHAAMFTGELPGAVGCHHEHPRLPDEAHTAAEALAARGYRTGAFVANPWVGAFNGLTQGFDHEESHWQRSRAARAFTLSGLLPAAPSGKGGLATVRAALRWLDRRPADQPSFAFINLLEAHSPFHHVPAPALFGVEDPERSGGRMHRVQHHGPQTVSDFPLPGEVDDTRRLYAAAVHAADALLGEILQDLPAEARLIVTSDHGEAFGEHGFYGHMAGLHPETLHVPLVVRGAEVPAGLRIDEPVSTRLVHDLLLRQDLRPLLQPPAEAAAIISEQMRPLQVLSDFRAGTPTASPEQIAALDHRARRVQQGDTVLLRRGMEVVRFDLGADPAEQHPLPVGPEHAALLALVQQESLAAEPPPIASEDMPEDLRAQLRALGYLGDE